MKAMAFDIKNSMRKYDSNGFLHVEMTPISKACVNPYLGFEIPDYEELGLDKDRIYYALRAPEELKKGADTFNGLPLLLEHHEIDATTQPKEYIIGSTGTDAVFQDPYLKNSLTITDAEAIKAVEDGSCKEISCAYSFVPDFSEGEYEIDGQKIHYDFIMREIQGNHVALVPEGRAGHDVAVADEKPPQLKRSEKPMNKRQRVISKQKRLAKDKKSNIKRLARDKKIIAFKKRVNKLIADSDIEISADDILSSGFQKAINAIEAQIEGYDPNDIGLSVDSEASVEEIVDTFMPGLDEETKGIYTGVLEKLKGEEPSTDDDIEIETDDEVEVSTDDDIEVSTDDDIEIETTDGDLPCDDDIEVSTDDDWLTEKMKDPAFKEAFEMGVKYGETKGQAEDDDEPEEGGEGVSVTVSTDSIKRLKKRITADAKIKVMRELKDHYRALNRAANKVKPLTGEITDPMAFDSAKDIYAFALRCAGKNPARYNKAAYEGIIDVLLETTPRYTMAADSAFSRSRLDDNTSKIFERLDNIE